MMEHNLYGIKSFLMFYILNFLGLLKREILKLLWSWVLPTSTMKAVSPFRAGAGLSLLGINLLQQAGTFPSVCNLVVLAVSGGLPYCLFQEACAQRCPAKGTVNELWFCRLGKSPLILINALISVGKEWAETQNGAVWAASLPPAPCSLCS